MKKFIAVAAAVAALIGIVAAVKRNCAEDAHSVKIVSDAD